jgi:hypothetical protein
MKSDEAVRPRTLRGDLRALCPSAYICPPLAKESTYTVSKLNSKLKTKSTSNTRLCNVLSRSGTGAQPR